MKKRWKIWMALALVFLMTAGIPIPAQASTGQVSMSVSAGNVNIGDSITVTLKSASAAGETAVSTMSVSYDASVLQFTACSESTYGGGNGLISVSTDSATITLKAVAAGSTTISASGEDGVVFSTQEELTSMSGSSKTVTVNNAASSSGSAGSTGTAGNTGSAGSTGTAGSAGSAGSTGTAGSTTLSANNSLSSLTISPGTLSPSFNSSTTKYTASVAEDVTSIAVNAKPTVSSATVQSVSGNTNLSVGQNTVSIVVKAENGTTATYTITVTRGGTDTAGNGNDSDADAGDTDSDQGSSEAEGTENNGMVVVNGVTYTISEEFTEEEIPTDFSETTAAYGAAEYRAVRFDHGTVTLLYLVNENGDGAFFTYDESQNLVYPFVRLSNGERYIIVLMPPAVAEIPENCVSLQLDIEGQGVMTVYQKDQTLAGTDTESIEDTETDTEEFDPNALGLRSLFAGVFSPMTVHAEETGELTTENADGADAAGVSAGASDFYLMYAVNNEGTEGWYQYDLTEDTYQRYAGAEVTASTEDEDYDALMNNYARLTDKYNALKSRNEKIIFGLIIACALLLILITYLVLKLKDRAYDEEDEEDDEETEYADEDEFEDDALSDEDTENHTESVIAEDLNEAEPEEMSGTDLEPEADTDQEIDPEMEFEEMEFEEDDMEDERKKSGRKRGRKEKTHKERARKVTEEDGEEDKTDSVEEDIEVIDLNDL